jgi:hypothetical protein
MLPASKITAERRQVAKHPLPISATDAGMQMAFIPLALNACAPNLEIFDTGSNVTMRSAGQSSKQLDPISSTEAGMETEISEWQWAKAEFPMSNIQETGSKVTRRTADPEKQKSDSLSMKRGIFISQSGLQCRIREQSVELNNHAPRATKY